MEPSSKLFEEFSREVIHEEPQQVERDPLVIKLELIAEKTRDKAIKDQVDTLKDDCVQYLRTILNLARFSQKLSYDPERYREGVQNADAMRRGTHNVLIDDLNIMSRMLAKLKIDNSWREELSSRETVEDWAINAGLGILSRNLEEDVPSPAI